MVYDYNVKHDGVFYPAGTDVPVETPKAEPVVEKAEVKDEPKPKVTPKKRLKK